MIHRMRPIEVLREMECRKDVLREEIQCQDLNRDYTPFSRLLDPRPTWKLQLSTTHTMPTLADEN